MNKFTVTDVPATHSAAHQATVISPSHRLGDLLVAVTRLAQIAPANSSVRWLGPPGGTVDLTATWTVNEPTPFPVQAGEPLRT